MNVKDLFPIGSIAQELTGYWFDDAGELWSTKRGGPKRYHARAFNAGCSPHGYYFSINGKSVYYSNYAIDFYRDSTAYKAWKTQFDYSVFDNIKKPALAQTVRRKFGQRLLNAFERAKRAKAAFLA